MNIKNLFVFYINKKFNKGNFKFCKKIKRKHFLYMFLLFLNFYINKPFRFNSGKVIIVTSWTQFSYRPF